MVTVKDYGNGDPAEIFYHTSSKEETDLIDKTVLQYLKRADESYGPNGRHERLRNLEETTSREYVSLVNNLVREREIMQIIKKQFKNGVQMAAVLAEENREQIVFSNIYDDNDAKTFRSRITNDPKLSGMRLRRIMKADDPFKILL